MVMRMTQDDRLAVMLPLQSVDAAADAGWSATVATAGVTLTVGE